MKLHRKVVYGYPRGHLPSDFEFDTPWAEYVDVAIEEMGDVDNESASYVTKYFVWQEGSLISIDQPLAGRMI
ncbi:hypothetical protein V5F77_18470 [Xanthobacter sp. DSM 24535]|uniref:hypothetical protein n=1 Tax=Roseixanthobacter psychrophilus TaxID=3119917 RepID=UPI00372C3251